MGQSLSFSSAKGFLIQQLGCGPSARLSKSPDAAAAVRPRTPLGEALVWSVCPSLLSLTCKDNRPGENSKNSPCQVRYLTMPTESPGRHTGAVIFSKTSQAWEPLGLTLLLNNLLRVWQASAQRPDGGWGSNSSDCGKRRTGSLGTQQGLNHSPGSGSSVSLGRPSISGIGLSHRIAGEHSASSQEQPQISSRLELWITLKHSRAISQ